MELNVTVQIAGKDGERYSYLDLVEFIEEEGSAPAQDLPELWRRVLFSCVVGNTDNHMRNYGFLRDTQGWRLAPSFDVNPTPALVKQSRHKFHFPYKNVDT
jgi:serine/threonine-protein kinase HipA